MAHNPPVPARLDIADRVGLLVIDENHFYGEHGRPCKSQLHFNRITYAIALFADVSYTRFRAHIHALIFIAYEQTVSTIQKQNLSRSATSPSWCLVIATTRPCGCGTSAMVTMLAHD